MAVENQPKTLVQDIDEAAVPQRQGSRLIGRILPVAVKLWLQTQAEQIEALSFQLEGTDRQILSGHIPGVSVSAQRAIYQGVHISGVQLAAREVHFNLGQVVRGKPLKLLKAFLMDGEVQLSEADLNASLNANYLAEGVGNFWRTLLAMPAVTTEIANYYDRTVPPLDGPAFQSIARIENDALTLQLGQARSSSGHPGSALDVTLRSQLKIHLNRFLILDHPCWLKTVDAPDGYSSQALAGFQWDLGSEACLRDLTLAQGMLTCTGQVLVKP
jgi:hypothetical protein